MGIHTFLEMIFFGGWKGTQLEFWKKLVYELVHNAMDVDGMIIGSLNTERVIEDLHYSYIYIPSYSKWVNGKWKKVYNRAY